MKPDLRTHVGQIELKNPVLTASGTFGWGQEYADLVPLDKLGGLVIKSVTLNPRKGNPPPRTAETPGGMLNSIGLENPGVDRFISEKLPFLRKLNTAVIASVAGEKISEYEKVVQRLDKAGGIDGFEINLSCPNVKRGGLAFGTDPNAVAQITEKIRKVTELTLIIKLTPNVTDIVLVAKAAESAGADAISLINTLTGMAIDLENRRPKLANITGGLSGPAIKPVALAMAWKVASAVELPVIGIGGILSAEDALEFLIAGANAVQIGTGNFIDPKCTLQIINGLRQYCKDNNIPKISELVGVLDTDI